MYTQIDQNRAIKTELEEARFDLLILTRNFTREASQIRRAKIDALKRHIRALETCLVLA